MISLCELLLLVQAQLLLNPPKNIYPLAAVFAHVLVTRSHPGHSLTLRRVIVRRPRIEVNLKGPRMKAGMVAGNGPHLVCYCTYHIQPVSYICAERDNADLMQGLGDGGSLASKRPKINRNRYNGSGGMHGLAKKLLPIDADKTRSGRKD